MTEKRSKRVAASIIAASMITAGFVALAVPANAVGGNCSSYLETQPLTGLDNFRARAICSSLQGDSKARAKLIRNGGPDYTGAYFTTLNKSYYTAWYTCYAGCSAAHEIAHV